MVQVSIPVPWEHPGVFSGEEAGEEGGSEGGVDTAGLLEVDAEDDRIGKGWNGGMAIL